MASHRYPGPLCRYHLFSEIDSGTLCRQASPVPGPVGRFSVWPDLYDPGFLPVAQDPITATDKAEFALIEKMPVYNHKRELYDTVDSYLEDRTRYFGSPAVYTAFAAESDTELETKWQRKKHITTLRSLLEFGHKPEQQKIFYRWVRKAYQLKYGDDVNIPELIRKGMSEKLAQKIADVRGSIRVKKIHDEDFKAGGFNPRPIKYEDHYLLGTLSEHATGMAVDIDDKKNPQLTNKEWKFIEELAGKSVNRFGRWKTETGAEGLWTDIKALSDLFVKKIATEVSRIEKERAEKAKKEQDEKLLAEAAKASQTKAEAGKAKVAAPKVAMKHSAKPEKPKPPLQEILGMHYGSLAKWVTTGFFHLPLELVLELHFHGFTWGATFSTNVDLHHFELDD
jgi:hypothetical protein